MPEYTSDVIAKYLELEPAEFTRLVRDGHIPKLKRKDGVDYFDLTASIKGYIAYLKRYADNRGISELAALFGVTVRQMQLLAADGVIKSAGVLGGRAHGREYDLKETCSAIYKYLSAKASGKSATEKEANLKADKLKAEIALKESQGELHRLRTAIAMKQYIAVEEVSMDYSRFFISFKNFAMAIPARLTDMVSAYVEPVEARRIEKELSEEMRRLLSAFTVAGVTEDQVKQRGRKK